jgi:outer membrane receptor protein involved in Fe transport
MKRNLIIVLFLALLLPSSLFAGNFGTIRGKVVDEEGKPIIGASVRVLGTRLGAFVKGGGKFIISNIPPGSYKVKITYVGYQDFIAEVRISADETTELTAQMNPEGVMTEEITVYGNELVRNKEIGIKREMSSEDLTSIAREGIQSIVGLSAGVFNSGNGFIIRGSRSNESQIRVDGFDVGNQFTGGFGIMGATYYPMVSQFATEELQVLTGGFSAEYGNALGGVVNTSLKTGRTDRYEGLFRWRTDVPFLFGKQKAGLKLYREGERLYAVDYGEGAKLQGANENGFDINVGGPIPFLGKTTFFISGRYFTEEYRTASYEIYDPWHYDAAGNWTRNNIGLRPGNRSWVKNITAKFKFPITQDIDFIVGAMYGITNIESNSWGWLYTTTPGSIEGLPSYGVPENIAKQNVFNQIVANFNGIFNHRLSSNSFYEIRVSNTTNSDDASKRSNYGDPNFFSGFELTTPQDEYTVELSELVPGRDKTLDQYQNVSRLMQTEDGYYYADFPYANPLTGYIEGPSSTSGSQNAYGMVGGFIAHGNNALQFRKGNYWQIDGNYNLELDANNFQHTFKTGFEVRLYSIKRHYNGLPWDGNPFMDVYTDEWGGNLYAYDQPSAYEKTSKGYNPVSAAFYIQDQITYKGIIFTPGLRFDFFDPNSEYRTILNPFQPIGLADSAFTSTSPKYQVSPRINVTYPITERSNISISYGLLFMMPQMQYMYDGFGAIQLRGNSIIGNPDLKAQRVNQYSIQYSNQLTDEFAFDVSAYYKDIYNQLGISYVSAVPDPYFLYEVADYGNSKGIEFTLRKMATNHFGFNINYNLSQSISTSPGPTSNYLVPQDFYTDKPAYPLAPFPTGSDRRHRINVILNFVWGRGEGPMIGSFGLLENTLINLTGFFQTGLPYTRTDKAGNALGEENAERQPSIWNANLRFQRGFWLRDWFGDGAGHTKIDFFVDINNVFNNRSAYAVYSRTGDPIDNGVSFYVPITSYPATTYYKEANYGIPASFSAEQYSRYGDRFYNVNGDWDKNGTVTQLEKRMSSEEQLEDSINFRGNFLRPITVFFGLIFRF